MATRNSHLDDDFFGTPLSSALSMPFNLEVGDIILGRVSLIDNEYVYVSTGFKSEGRIPRSEFQSDTTQDLDLKVDDEIEVMVDRVAGEDIYLSYQKVMQQRKWDELQKKFEDEESVSGTIFKAVKGGYRVDVGVDRHAFLSGSHTGLAITNPDDLMGRELKLMIIEINRESGNIVVSHRDVMKKEVAEKETSLFGSVQIGEIRDGKVTRLTNFGAFVDIGGIEGLVHISEIAWSRVAHPSAALSCGQEVRVKVLDCDPDKRRVALSIKQTSDDPWSDLEGRVPVGEVLDGTVAKIVKFGAFVRILKDFEGLLHVSEMGQTGGEILKKMVVGDTLKVKVISVDGKTRKIALGLHSDEAVADAAEMEKYLDDGKPHGKLGDVLRGARDDKTKS